MFTRRGKYVVRKLPANIPIGSATTLLDAADVAMEDARGGPGKWVIEQPDIEVDVSRVYGSLNPETTGPIPATPTGLRILEVTPSSISAACDSVDGADGYLWYLDGVPVGVSQSPNTIFVGLLGVTQYTVAVASMDGYLLSHVSDALPATTAGNDAPLWQVSIADQNLVVGTPVDLELSNYIFDETSFTHGYSVVSGTLPTGLSLVGSRVLGTPTAVSSGGVVFRLIHTEHPAQHQTDSNTVAFVVLNADVTPPDPPTNFAATGYSSTSVRLTWTNPADDATVANEVKSGFLGIDVYRSTEPDGVGGWLNWAKITRVLATDPTPAEYVADATQVCGWKVRSVDVAFNKGAYTADASAGPLVAQSNPPKSVTATRVSGTQASVSWAAGDGSVPTKYYVYWSTSASGPWTQVDAGLALTYLLTSGFTLSQSVFFYVTAVVLGAETVGSATAVALADDVTTEWRSSFDVPDVNVILLNTALISKDAYDPTVDPDIQSTTARARYSVGDNGQPARSLKVQLTQHTYGTNNWPNDNAISLPGAMWRYKNGGTYPAGTDNVAHRIEVKGYPANPIMQILNDVEYWFGWSQFYPGPNDPLGDAEMKPSSWFYGWNFDPQLHPVNLTAAQLAAYGGRLIATSAAGGFNPVWALSSMSDTRNLGVGGLIAYPVPSGAPVVRYRRGSDTVGLAGGSGGTLYMEWDAVASATQYKIIRSVRSEGPYVLHATVSASATQGVTFDQSTVGAGNAARTYTETNLGTNTANPMRSAYVKVVPVFGGVEGTPSLPCPSRRSCFGAQVYGVGYNGPISYENGYSEGGSFGGVEAWDLRGSWVDFVLRFRLNQNHLGYYQLWMNDTEVARVMNFTFGRTEGAPRHYWNWGIYHGRPQSEFQPIVADWPWRRVVYFDEFHLARRTTLTTSVVTDIEASAAYQHVKPRGVRT